MTGHNLLAVRVMVTSDGSSSEFEPDFNGDPVISELNEGPLSCPRSCTPSSQAPLLLNTSLIKMEEKSKPTHALQRACSLRDTSTSGKYQQWKKKIQSNFPLLYSKKNGPSSKDTSTNLHSNAAKNDRLEKELMSPNEIPKIAKGHFEAHSPTFHMEREVTNTAGKIPSCVSHSLLDNDRYRVSHNNFFCYTGGTSAPVSPTKVEIKDCDSEEDQYLGNQAANSETLISKLFVKDSNTFSVNPDVDDQTASPSAKEQHDRYLKKAKCKIMRKLTLSMEQQSKLLAMNDAKLEETRIEPQGEEAIPGQNDTYLTGCKKIPEQSRGDTAFKISDHSPILFPEHKFPKNVDNCPKEPTTTQPKSPLRLIANAIKKSILDPLISSPENLKKSHKIPLENTFSNFPPVLSDSVSAKNSKNSAGCERQAEELSLFRRAEKRSGIRSSDISNFANNPNKEYPCDAFPVYNMHVSHTKRPDKSKDASYTNVEDVPTLLERFTLKENLWKSAKDDWNAHNGKNIVYSSLRYKDKSSSVASGSSVQKNNVWNLFSNFRNKLDDKVKAPSSTSSVSPCTIFDVDEVLNNSSKGAEHLPVRKQTTEDCSSSSDDESLHKPLLRSKTKGALRRSRKLEKEMKQLAKQEELKRLHKAQAIQRLLEEVEEKQRALEVYGVQLERELRGEADSSTQDDTQLLHEWFGLVLEKNKLMRYESELLIIAKELELEDHQN